MRPKKIWANLATNDLQRTFDFYSKLGFEATSAHSHGLVSISIGESSFVINFFLKDILQSNTCTPITDLKSGSEVIISLSAEGREEVNHWVDTVRKAGGEISVEPYEIGPGYTFVFADPDGHKFNVLYWPGM